MGIVTTNGKLADAIQRLDALTAKLQDPTALLDGLGATMVEELRRVQASSPYATGARANALDFYQVVDTRHVAVGDPAGFGNWMQAAPKGTIAEFIRYMLENKLGFIPGWRRKKKGSEKQAKVKAKNENRVSKKAQKAAQKETEIEKYRKALHRILPDIRADLSDKEADILLMYPNRLAKTTYQGKRFGFKEQREWAYAELAKLNLKGKQLEEARWYIEETYADKVKRESEVSQSNRLSRKRSKLQQKMRSEYEVSDSALEAALEIREFEKAARRKRK